MLLALAVVAGCGPAAGVPTATNKAAGSPQRGTVTPGGKKPGGGAVQPPAGTATPLIAPGNGIVSNNSGAIAGQVRAPAGVISNNGGGLISDKGGALIGNNGGGVISNNGAGYRLLAALEQVPVANRTVQLLDGAGSPVLVDGNPVTTTTDAQGRYRFDVTLPSANRLVAVALPGEAGSLLAVAPKGSATATDVDLVSTLTTGYIVETYVATQADRQAALDRLPPEVEADTRAKTAAALALPDAKLPGDVSTAAIIATINDLRDHDAALDAQMETVKRLIVLAGVSDLGNGKPATTVSLGQVSGLVVAPDGTVYFGVSTDGRVWKLGADGLLVSVAGNGQPEPFDEGHLDGLQATTEGVAPGELALDDRGRLVIHASSGFYRLGLDGALRLLAPGIPKRSVMVTAGPQRTIYLGTTLSQGGVTIIGADGKPTVLSTPDPSIVPGLTVRRVEPSGLATMTLTGGWPPGYLTAAWLAGGDATGAIYLGGVVTVGADKHLEYWRVAPDGSGTLYQQAPFGQAQVGKDGTYYTTSAGGVLQALRPGASAPIALPAGLASQDVKGWGPKGECYYVSSADRQHFLVHRFLGGQDDVIAGQVQAATTGQATDLALTSPSTLDFLPGGDMLVYDDSRILRVRPDTTYTVYGQRDASRVAPVAVGSAVADIELPPLAKLATDAAGDVFVLVDDEAILGVDPSGKPIGSKVPQEVIRFDPTGKITAITRPPAGQRFHDIAVARDGTLYAGLATVVSYSGPVSDFTPPPGSALSLARLQPDGSFQTLITAPFDLLSILAVAVSPDGAAYMTGHGKLERFANGTAELLATDARLGQLQPKALAVGASGRVYVGCFLYDSMLRFDPATKQLTAFAGKGGIVRTGDTVDDGFSRPGAPAFNAAGDLVVPLESAKQVIRLPASQL